MKLQATGFSPIRLQQRLAFPETFFCHEDDFLIGLNMTYDNHLVVVTSEGNTGLIPITSAPLSTDDLQSYRLDDCPDEPSGLVSNSIAIDESGGIFIVTSQEVIRLQWNGDTLSFRWRAPYEAGDGSISALRLGPGSGSTPSLMGTDANDDRFVVITDGQPLMHLVLLWRDEIPANWEGLGPDIDRRIACQVPVRFGDPEATRSLSEQSVLVYGYATVLVNNLLQQEAAWWSAVPEGLRPIFGAGAGGNPTIAPTGLERIDWDPETRRCHTVWSNASLSIPNGIPTMSAATQLIYGIGQRDGTWGLEAIDFDSGQSEFFIEARQKRCSLAALQQLEPRGLRLFAAARVSTNPRSCENAFYAATEIGPDASIYTGTLLGVTKYASYPNR